MREKETKRREKNDRRKGKEERAGTTDKGVL